MLPEYREYERGISTWLNSYVGPRVQGYMQRLGSELGGGSLAVMRSSGETCEAAQAGREAVHLLLSGPAGGLAGARHLARLTGNERVLTFDMGGTSTDVAMIDGEIRLTSEGRIGPYPVGVPMVDLHTIGAGGGSIARIDAGGLLAVGPASAGADPGPACYGRGGDQPTVTDANVVLGRLPAGQRLGGSMALDRDAAVTALQRLAGELGLDSPEAAAEGVIRVANEHMAAALRVISVQRGLDPREFALVSFGGAGGLHVCALAEMLGMRRALAPIHGGVLSALGMLAAPRGRQLSRTLGVDLAATAVETIETALEELAGHGREALAAEGIAADALEYEPSLDLCYRGQSYTLNLPWTTPAECEQAFHAAHEQRFGHRLQAPVQLVNVRMAVRAPVQALILPDWQAGETAEPAMTRLHGIDEPVPVWPRTALAAGQALQGPAIIAEAVSTLYLAPGWRALIDTVGNVDLDHIGAAGKPENA
ncbi:MAG: hydantoinase/oxoprolinase family protein [Gammaproteobacteria bacterium]|nr:hydantoinase/oxoprolinase family protein [Gammaproteobacteria bacterium]